MRNKITAFYAVCVLICILVQSGTSQQIKTVGVQFGTLIPQGNWNTGFISNANINLKKTYKSLRFQPFFSYQINSFTESISTTDRYELKFSNFTIGMNILFKVKKITRKSEIYTGPGLSFNFLNSDYLSPSIAGGNPEIKEKTDKKIGFGALAGYIYNFGTVSGIFETKYEYIQGGYNNIQISIGCLFNVNR